MGTLFADTTRQLFHVPKQNPVPGRAPCLADTRARCSGPVGTVSSSISSSGSGCGGLLRALCPEPGPTAAGPSAAPPPPASAFAMGFLIASMAPGTGHLSCVSGQSSTWVERFASPGNTLCELCTPFVLGHHVLCFLTLFQLHPLETQHSDLGNFVNDIEWVMLLVCHGVS